MAFELKNVPDTLQRGVDVILVMTKLNTISVYLNNLVIYFKTANYITFVEASSHPAVESRVALTILKRRSNSNTMDYLANVTFQR